MIEIRRFGELGRFQTDWLDARYHFSFANYVDPARMGHGRLRVWNDDTIQPGTGFPPHGHRAMEIVTYVREGAITHADSLGNQGRTIAGDVQVMSAGEGVRHAEWNQEPGLTRIFQLWIEPRQPGGRPRWGTRSFPKADRAGAWAVLASGLGDEGALEIDQDSRVLGATLQPGQALTYDLPPDRGGYLVLAAGQVQLNGARLAARDGAALAPGTSLTLEGLAPAEIVLVDTV